MSLACLNNAQTNLMSTLHDNGILELVLNRPERKNAFFGDFYMAVVDALVEADQSNDVKVVLLRGEQDFSAGNDLQDFVDHPPTDRNAPAFLLLLAATNLSKPLVIAVKGVAIGIGSTLLLHADLVYADSKARFQMPFLSLGLTPEGGATLLLPERAGHLKAAEILMLAEPFNAQAALEAGLVNQVITEDTTSDQNGNDVYAFAMKKAVRLTQLPVATLKTTKQLLRSRIAEVTERIQIEGDLFVERVGTPAMHEAITAFKEKRAPDFNQFD